MKGEALGVEEKVVKVCEGVYRVEMRVVTNGAKSRWLGIEMGLRQGCPCSYFSLVFV